MANALHIDTLKFSRRLVAAGMEPAAAEAIAETFGEIDTSELATKSDLRELRAEMREMENRLVIKTGGMIVGALAILMALMRLIPPG
ncbi:DUF1640 domain-containing protein [Paracoccus siganidrum]|uniref:DUF1640 domain-containing protein n=1 Tax=Paracoccus siganidrum TaxID=1276757 RepID=A0A419A9B3_9RHOB|nr:DUF1640 domain-containing protein [Paracoccus siganidrum]RJL19223.1 DUF1640 domain-containing protein [Paracoccus siganidrum]RMC39285.1 DUF1640 domain-containing protein [Paracoccus siganidrum]